jgi:4-amino-4-deoxy-L-arabinose transferase-like glycosyltransferase
MTDPLAARVVAHRRPHPAVTLAALALLGGALTVYYLAVLRIDLHRSWILNMDPHPDADEYMAGAVSMARDGIFRIHNGGRMVPSRYPFGFSMMSAPLVWLGVEPVMVTVRLNQLLGLALIITPFALFWRARDRLGAGLTSLFMATLPGVLTLARSPMSDLAGATMVLAAFYCFWRFVRSRPDDLHWGIAGAALLGVAIWVRTPNLMYVGLAGLVGFFGQPLPFWRRIRTLLILGVAFAIAVTPVLLYNYWSFDDPLKTGYDFWMPRRDGGSSSAPAVAFAGPARAGDQGYFIWNEFIQRERGMNVARLFGTGSYLNPSLMLLALVGAVTALFSRDRASVVIGCSAVVTFLPVLVLRTSDVRNWFVFPLMLPFVAGRQLSAILRHAAEAPRRDWVSITAVVLLCAAAASGWPGRNGWFEVSDLTNIRRFRGTSERYAAVRHLARLTAGQRTLVFTNFNPSYVYALTDGDRVVSPFHHLDMPTFNEAWLPPNARKAQLDDAVSNGRVVYALLLGRSAARRLPPLPPGYVWVDVWRSRGGTVLRRLVKP